MAEKEVINMSERLQGVVLPESTKAWRSNQEYVNRPSEPAKKPELAADQAVEQKLPLGWLTDNYPHKSDVTQNF